MADFRDTRAIMRSRDVGGNSRLEGFGSCAVERVLGERPSRREHGGFAPCPSVRRTRCSPPSTASSAIRPADPNAPRHVETAARGGLHQPAATHQEGPGQGARQAPRPARAALHADPPRGPSPRRGTGTRFLFSNQEGNLERIRRSSTATGVALKHPVWGDVSPLLPVPPGTVVESA
jgi:hypothetical protein